jgi:hypothetical protein
MKNKAYFFVDMKNLDMLSVETTEAISAEARPQKYKVIADIPMTQQEFDLFRVNIRMSFEFLQPYRMKTDMNTDYEYEVVRVSSDTEGGGFPILVACNGYTYPRLAAIEFPDLETMSATINFLKETKP